MKNILIIGGGISGRAAKTLADALKISARIVCDAPDVNAETEIKNSDFAIVSPGVRVDRSELYRAALHRASESGKNGEEKYEIVSELAFGSRYLDCSRMLAVTGTNGKTTTVELTVHLLNELGIPAIGCGNIGLAVSLVAEKIMKGELPPDILPVLEVSSFQLERAGGFAPFAAAMMNLESDHLDRYHGSFGEYCRVKYQIFDSVLPENQIFGLSMELPVARRATVHDGTVFWDGKPLAELSRSRLAAPHNTENLAAALELALRVVPPEKLDWEKLKQAVYTFNPGHHRLEKVTEINGIVCINDSKATNPAAVIAAFHALKEHPKIVVLLGGLDKGMDFSSLSALSPRIRLAVLYGECRSSISKVLKGKTDCVDCGMDFVKAVDSAMAAAKPGDAVLLSPACASMDMFKNYQERGDQFARLVAEKNQEKSK